MKSIILEFKDGEMRRFDEVKDYYYEDNYNLLKLEINSGYIYYFIMNELKSLLVF